MRFLLMLTVSAGIHAYLLWNFETRRSVQLLMRRGESAIPSRPSSAGKPATLVTVSFPKRPKEIPVRAPTRPVSALLRSEFIDRLEKTKALVSELARNFTSQLLPPAPAPVEKTVERPSASPIETPEKEPPASPPRALAPAPRKTESPPTPPQLPGAPAAPRTQGVQSGVRVLGDSIPYPLEAYRLGIEGTVTIELHFSAEGRVARAKILESSGYSILDEHTLRHLDDIHFDPDRVGLQPIPIIRCPVSYSIKKRSP